MNTNNDQIVNQGQSFKVITNVQLTTVHLRRIMDLVRKKLGSIPTELGSNPLYVRIYLQAYHSNNLWLTGTIQVQHHVESEGESSNNDILHDSFEEQITDIKEEADLKIPSTTVVLTTCIYPLCASPQSHDVYNCWSIRRICCHCGKRGHESVHHQFIPDWFFCASSQMM
ncbi:unnamed protein product [Lepeophtheirus salmonis]|uniref:(salmon louse) hypothetical protein n=1 Tax=Lepeophtheirus salmonis TaxID=72036 RepID=A0A7R8CDI5_LEPSM|nr:unnamed protein product [Lepeophtheirus salmonis]CAF2781373.1 unnamed protein product [Lepeophtheirus salmonis]